MAFVKVDFRGNQLSDADAGQVKRVQDAIIGSIQPFMANTDPLVGVIALARCLRVMLRSCSREAAKTMLPIVIDYLRGRNTPRHEGLLWLPGEPRDN